MGSYLNVGTVLFQQTLNSEIYVDKTGLIDVVNKNINTKRNLMCVSRPRRFGKSMALEMFAAYYSRDCDANEMFAPLEIAKCDSFLTHLNQYDTLLIDMQGILGDVLYQPEVQKEVMDLYRNLPKLTKVEKDKLEHPQLVGMQKEIIAELREQKEMAEYIREEETSLGNALLSVYKATGRKFILLIDEWDCVFRNSTEDTLLHEKYIEFLRGLFKNTRLLPVFALVYMTGILPIKRYGTQSALNNFEEYTMLEATPIEEYIGFTEKETRNLYKQYGMDVQKAKQWYDGYCFPSAGHIYNPNSVVQSIYRKKYRSFWTATGTYESVKHPIDMNFDGLKDAVITMLGGGRYPVNTSKFQNDMVSFYSCDDVLTFLVHLGYLGYDSETKEVYIPNKEIRDEFVNAIDGNKWTKTYEAISNSKKLLQATLEGEEELVAKSIEKVHEDNTAILTYNDENSLSCVMTLAYFWGQDEYEFIRELPAGKGFADLVFVPRKGVEKPAIVVELKWTEDAETAIWQIKNRNYSDNLKDYFGEVVLVGVHYDKKSKEHKCKIERVEK